jgi:hypothetical protein
MATGSTMLYSAAAVRRMLGLRPSAPVQLREFFNVVWVWVKGRRPTFISKAELRSHFVEHRQAEAEALEVADWLDAPPRFTVTNPATGSRHGVNCLPDRVVCDCEDYHWQVYYFSRGCCKHGYAALAYLGYNSLRDYVADHRHDAAANHREVEPNRREIYRSEGQAKLTQLV